jgi:beta-lactam-binding protein with PASTA domain
VVRCTVPRVIGLTLGRAKTKIRRANCSVGRIRRAHSRRVGRVIGQSPRPGVVKPRGFRVNLVVGRR